MLVSLAFQKSSNTKIILIGFTSSSKIMLLNKRKKVLNIFLFLEVDLLVLTYFIDLDASKVNSKKAYNWLLFSVESSHYQYKRIKHRSIDKYV